MWWYENVTRVDFEAVNDTIEQIMFRLGASKYEIRLPYEVKTTSYLDDFEETHRSERSVFTYKGLFFRVDEVFFSQKPIIVIETRDQDNLKNNNMEEPEPFQYDL